MDPERVKKWLIADLKCRSSKKEAQLEIELCKRNPGWWIKNWVWTLDTHDKKKPIKMFPDKDYLYRITEVWQNERLLLIPKSRQMLITWLIVSLYLHDAQFNNGRFIFFQSKKEKDADALIERAHFILRNEPGWMRPKFRKSYCLIEFPGKNSKIVGIPQGGDQIRMHTASGIFLDEAAFMWQAEEAYTAAKPSIDGGGRITLVSSANPGFFECMVSDKIK